jgi:co-chaperonin GroES (HSP10)
MRLSKEEFSIARPLSMVVVKVDFLEREEINGIILPKTSEGQQEYCNHKGIVAKTPRTRSTPISCGKKTNMEVEVGDTVYYLWNTLAFSKPNFDTNLVWEVEDDIYVLMPYIDLVAAERGGVKFGLGGNVVGKLGERIVPTIQLLGVDWEQEYTNAIITKSFTKMGDTKDRTKMTVTHAPTHLPEYFGYVPQHLPRQGDVIRFPEGFAAPLGSAHTGDEELFVIECAQIMGIE